MFTAESIPALREQVQLLRRGGLTIGFVPTMGYLHEGHLSLVRLARQCADRVIVSIFVNPTQFNQAHDLERYPRDIPRDLAMLRGVDTTGVFLPTPELMYGPGFESWVNVEQLTRPLEGAHRPGHFRGVTTVVAMLFNAVQPDCAVFGEKDFQQLRIIERMVHDLKFNLQVIRGPLVRDPDGLAMSSRNVRLTPESRARALGLSRGLLRAAACFRDGERSAARLRQEVLGHLEGPGVEIEYVAVADEATLGELTEVDRPSRILAAVTVGGVRLIDNIALTPA